MFDDTSSFSRELGVNYITCLIDSAEHASNRIASFSKLPWLDSDFRIKSLRKTIDERWELTVYQPLKIKIRIKDIPPSEVQSCPVVSPKPTDSNIFNILVENHPNVTYGDIAISIGRYLIFDDYVNVY
jgi:hypothetical protein